MKCAGSVDQRTGGKRRYAIDFSPNVIVFYDFFQQQVKISITGQQYHNVHVFCRVHDVNSDANVPIALGGAVAALYIGFEFDGKADLLEGVLKFVLFVVVSFDGVRGRADDISLRTDAFPEFPVVKLTAIGLSGGVINVLYVDKNRNFFHG